MSQIIYQMSVPNTRLLSSAYVASHSFREFTFTYLWVYLTRRHVEYHNWVLRLFVIWLVRGLPFRVQFQWALQELCIVVKVHSVFILIKDQTYATFYLVYVILLTDCLFIELTRTHMFKARKESHTRGMWFLWLFKVRQHRKRDMSPGRTIWGS